MFMYILRIYIYIHVYIYTYTYILTYTDIYICQVNPTCAKAPPNRFYVDLYAR